MLRIGSFLLLSLIVPSSAYSLDLKQKTGEQCNYLFEQSNTEYGWSGYCVKPNGNVYREYGGNPTFEGKIGTPTPTNDLQHLKQFEIENNKLVEYKCFTGGAELECASSAKKTVYNWKMVSDRNGPRHGGFTFTPIKEKPIR